MSFPDSATKTADSNSWRLDLLLVAAIFTIAGTIEFLVGSLPLGPDGKFGWWDGDIWSSETSQRFADPYSFSHLTHGILFFLFLRYVAPRLPLSKRLVIAVLMAAGWELLENSPLIIHRYRATTISMGYNGDSILNSMSDIFMMCLGFAFASQVRLRVCVAAILLLEIGCLYWMHDNLTLNIIMLLHPVEAIKQWQMSGAPTGLAH